MIILAFMMNKVRSDLMYPEYWSNIPYFYGVILTAPLSAWLLIRWNRWTRVAGLAVVAISVAISLDALRDAFSRGIWIEYGFNLHFLLPCFGAAILPVATATAAFVLPKRKPPPPTPLPH